MRHNLPVNASEYPVPAGLSIVSRTDLSGVITYANDAFVEISGFSREELIGQPHNLVRHPDMPEQVFAHLWATLTRGNPWKGIVKNRRKDGSHYWVSAVVVPVRKDNATIGYMSVREAATREQIARAEAEYAALRASGRSLREHPLQRLLTIRSGFRIGVLFVIALMLAGGFLGIGGLRDSSQVVGSLYHERLKPLAQASRLDAVLQELQRELATDAGGGGAEAARAQALLARLQAAEQEADGVIRDLQARPWPAPVDAALGSVVGGYDALRSRELTAVRQALADGRPYVSPAPAFAAVHGAIAGLTQGIDALAAREQQALAARNAAIRDLALAGIAFGLLVVVVVGRFFLRDIVQPLEGAIRSFDRMAQGDLSGEVEVEGRGETGQLLRACAVMQMHLKVITDEISCHGRNIHDHCMRLNAALFEISDHSEIQHDRLSEARNFLSLDFADELKAELDSFQQQLVCLRLSAGDLPELDALQLSIDKIGNLLHLQSFALEDFVGKIDQILDLVVDNRQDTQQAYAMSEHLEAAAHQMNELVSYFSTRRDAGPG